MAIFKATGVTPPVAQRINGLVYGTGPNSRQLRGWGNPRTSPSDRFTSYDDLSRYYGIKWESLPPATQAPWTAQAQAYYTEGQPLCLPRRLCLTCDLWIPYPITRIPPNLGKKYFASTQISREIAGIPISPIVPPWYLPLATEWMNITDGPPYLIYILASNLPPPGPIAVQLWATIIRAPGAIEPTLRRAYSWLGYTTVPIPGTADITPEVEAWTAIHGHGTIRIAAGTSPEGDSPANGLLSEVHA